MSVKDKSEGRGETGAFGFSLFGGREDEESNNLGGSNYAKKAQIIEQEDDLAATASDFGELGNFIGRIIATELPKQANRAFKAARKGLTPGFVVRMNNRKIYAKKVESTEKILDTLYSDEKLTIEAELAQSKVKRLKDKLMAEKVKAQELLLADTRAALDAATHEFIIQEHREFHKRLQDQHQEMMEMEERRQRELFAKKEKEDLELRKWRIEYFGQQAKDLGLEAESMAPAKLKQERNLAIINRIKNEWEDRENSRTRLQVEYLPKSDFVGIDEDLGIFGQDMSIDPEADDLVMEDFDTEDVHNFDTPQFAGFESKVSRLEDKKAELAQNEDLYNAMQFDAGELKEAIDRMLDMKDVLEKEQRQINQEIMLIERVQSGPPRRLANAAEIPSMDMWKKRSAQTNQKIRNMQYSIEKARKKRDEILVQSLVVAKTIAVLKDSVSTVQEELDESNEGLGNLPMIVGRNISKAPGMGILAKPKELLKAVVVQSQLIGIKTLSETAIKLHKDASKVERQIWASRLNEEDQRNELEGMISRISRITEKLQKSKTDAMRANIIDSLNGFFQSGLLLNQVNKRIVGILPWYKHHDYMLSQGVLPYVTTNVMGAITFELEEAENIDAYSNGVTLGPQSYGHCCGHITLPKDCIWNISVTITKQGSGEDFDNPNPNDFVTVKFGPTASSLSKVGTFFNRVNPATGTVLYDVKHVLRGNCFAFRFDFFSLSPDVKRHLAVCTGIYEEYSMQELEVISDPINPRKTRVLSSYVKMIRVEEQSGQMREMKLLEELVDVENCKQLYWDSKLLTHTIQRFAAEYYKRILKAEILLQQAQSKQTFLKQQEEMQKARGLMADADIEKEARLEQSMKKYLQKKRALEQKKVELGREMVGIRLVLWDPLQNKWRLVLVVDCIINWVENGQIAQVSHMVQEYNEGFENIGSPIEIRLDKYKYFRSPVQVAEKDSLVKWREKKAWEDAIQNINEAMEKRKAEFAKVFDSYKAFTRKNFHRMKQRILNALEKSIDEKAEEVASSEAGQKGIEEIVPDVILDLKRGILIEDESMKPEEQIQMIAKQRFIHRWMKRRRENIKAELDQTEKEMKVDFQHKTYAFNLKIKQIEDEAAAEQEVFRDKIRVQYKEQKRNLLKALKFPREVFQKVLPRAFNCEHLHTKAWGDLYKTGVRCVDCGKELSDLHEYESQLLGYGTGADPQLWEAINRHKDNEASFRFRSGEELALVESERVRLEKERREMELSECYFYDFQDLQVIYDFDNRHAQVIKASGIFRQGVHWTQDEIEFFEQRKLIQEKIRLENEGLPETMLTQFDPLSEVENPPPTFRAADERRQAQYNEFIFNIGRLHNFRRRIHAYKMRRFDLLFDLDVFTHILECLHKDSFLLEVELHELEVDLDRTSRLLITFAKMKRLWQQASLIQSQAKKETMKAEMNRCGVWEDVRETTDKYNLIHDEMRTLLKTKALTEAKLDDIINQLDFRKSQYHELKHQYHSKHHALEALRYCKPGNLVYTKFGQCYIISYRMADDMILVNLPFGKPQAKAYLHYREVVDFERKLQAAEQRIMEEEDASMQRWTVAERIKAKKERYLMQKEEEACRVYFEFMDLKSKEEKLLVQSVNDAVNEAYLVTESKLFQEKAKAPVRESLNKVVTERNRRRKNYIGPENGRPKAFTMYGVYQLRKAIERDLKLHFIEKAAKAAGNRAKAENLETRSAWIRNFSFHDMIDKVMKEMVYEVAYEAYSEGRDAKMFTEKKIGIYLREAPWMQYSTYSFLASIWQHRKEDLKKNIELKKGESAKILAMDDPSSLEEKQKLTREEIRKKRQEKRLRKIELQRQKKLCDEMRLEEIRCKDFYRWELKENLRERRLMRQEEQASMMIRQLEQKLKREEEEAIAMMRSAAGGGGSGGGAGGGKALQLNAAKTAELAARRDLEFTYERRRKELKDLTLERRRREEDRALMVLEDDFGKLLREVDVRERQKKAYIKEFGADPDEEAEQNPDDIFLNKDGSLNLQMVVSQSSRQSLKKPDWMLLPKKFETWPMIKQNKYIIMMMQVRAATLRIDKNIQKEEKKLYRLENKSFKEWDRKFRVAELQEMQAELAMMEAQEELFGAEAKLKNIKENINKISLLCRERGEEELKIKSELKRREQVARQREEELKEAQDWLDVCARRAKNRDKLKRKVSNDCRWIDTDSINGFHQRFATELLRERLYMTYFKQIVTAIVNRSEIIATERKLAGIQYELSVNRVKLADRSSAMQSLLRSIRAEEMLRLRRSALNEKIFSLARRATLLGRFKGWVRYFYWNKGNQDAFKLKYEVIRRQLDIDRQFREQLKRKKQIGNGSGSGSANANASDFDEDKRIPGEGVAPTLLHRLRERSLQCKQCLTYYVASQNHSMACGYHPGTYIMLCPISCAHPGLTALCSSHRKRRWSCCRNTDSKAQGCGRKYHVPPDSDPIYDAIMQKIRERDEQELNELNEEVEAARQADYPRQVVEQRNQQLNAVEEQLAEARRIAARFKDLKFV